MKSESSPWCTTYSQTACGFRPSLVSLWSPGGFLFLLLSLLLPFTGYSQRPASGEYDYGINIAYDSSSKQLSGYFEGYLGWHEELKIPMFSCLFYFTGTYEADTFSITSFEPDTAAGEIIPGIMHFPGDDSFVIRLEKEHGGCWNVQHFADETLRFTLQKRADWIQIKYITTEKAYFYKEPSVKSKTSSYLIQNNMFCIEKISGEWAYGTYFGEKETSGWIRLSDLNKK